MKLIKAAAPPEVDTTEELARRKDLSDAVVRNLKIIADDATDLGALEHRLANLTTSLQLAREFSDSLNLEQLEKRLASIASALRIIESSPTVTELEAER
jgi:uncharacterized protein with HEPN domain